MAANVQYPYKEINLTQIEENNFTHDHRTVLPATFYNQNTMETYNITLRAVSYYHCDNPGLCSITMCLPRQHVTKCASN